MKAQLEFNLADPDERDEHLRCTLSQNLCAVIWEMDQWLRGQVKYGEDNKRAEILDEARTMLSSIMTDENINLDILYK